MTYIALLRGINVSGHKKIPMAELRELLSNIRLHNVRTYIQSGNVVFQSKITDNSKLENVINQAILSHFGFDVPVFVKTHSELQSILDACPFSEEKMESSYFILLNSEPENNDIVEIQKISSDKEEFVIASNCIFIFYAIGAGKAKLGTNWFEKKLKVSMTARNYRTMMKLIDMSAN